MCELNNHNAVCTFAMESVKKISDFIVEILEEFTNAFNTCSLYRNTHKVCNFSKHLKHI